MNIKAEVVNLGWGWQRKILKCSGFLENVFGISGANEIKFVA